MAIVKTFTCSHCLQSSPQLGSDDEHGLSVIPVKGQQDYVCPFCGNRMLPPGGLFSEGGARNTSRPNLTGAGGELQAGGKLLSVACAAIVFPGPDVIGTVTLDGIADGDLTVGLVSSVPGVLTVPASVVVTNLTAVKTFAVHPVGAGTSVITASAVGSTPVDSADIVIAP